MTKLKKHSSWLVCCMMLVILLFPFWRKFFIDESKSLYDKLVDIVNNSQFSSDVDYYNNKPAAPHEIMSVVVALKQFDSF